ncbi:unnamed protein product [Blepharisma stoltei]|uniref:J domain-containing protein n=1 Tax=Blepharisma stoltei TaxID=1481888 RepID=A0AAU9JC66_9CILI|nr:unnamed protein product [Blepharisma stoltei]
MLIKQFFPKHIKSIFFRKFTTTDTPKNYYAVLNIPEKSTELEIRQAYLRLVKKHHPDCPAGNSEKFKQVNEAYKILSDKSLRSLYDSGNFYPKGIKTNNRDPYKNSQDQKNLHEEWLRQKEKRSKKSEERQNIYYNGKSIDEIFKQEKERQRKYQMLIRDHNKEEKHTWLSDTFAVIYTIVVTGLIFYTVYLIVNNVRQRKKIEENLHSIKMWKLQKEIERLKEINQSQSETIDKPS